MSETVLQVRNLAKRYGPVVALRSVDLDIKRGEIHALLGANGAGKSTLVKILSGVAQADAGSIMLTGRSVRFRNPSQARAAGLATVFQEPALIGELTVRENLSLTHSDPDQVREALASFGVSDLQFDELVRDLPLFLLRLIDLAKQLVLSPRVLLLDELTAALPSDITERVFSVLREAVRAGQSILFISHRLAEVMELCDRCTVLRDGCNVETFEPRDGGEGRMVAAMLGTSPEQLTARESRVIHQTREQVPLLDVKHLTVGPLRDVSFSVHKGEVVGLIALEGQGQDVLFAALAGEYRPSSGQIVVCGKPLSARGPADAIRQGLVLVPADRATALLPKRPIRENLTLPLYARFRSWGAIRWKAEKRRIEDVVRRLAIDARAGAAGRLSGGNQQKLTIGRWLASGFQVLLLFDPTRGIDIGTKRQLYVLIRDLAAAGAGILMFTSELREISLVADRVLVLYNGQIIEELPPDTDEETLLSACHGLEVAR
ncbi:monosaccharide ABC transporter ATP-binding protein, CUT2 family [Acidothermus cellulolyticus 11B]|uniref:Monosaccharide ABC transporter ATP-binding protein, CUT2 family n=1 Tax=Acidothermus cellulolyticus (strain ATCC 43068 / DSM 8971 / 11B) TaxID=351607 RepID=A0LSE1_ACIC1|nr:sugar ABC transporter ATP-binding protein [Acidothermus cellulolyticus]ABK52351.1 monosaccharide ABC transporter ATP-binding protein, CUT2 family [Acidothermus cellulolyticus 11B]